MSGYGFSSMTNLTKKPTTARAASSAPSEPAWFCVRSHLKHEHIAAAHLARIPEVTAFNPRLRVLRSTRRGRVWNTESLFPNYLFVRFALETKLERVRHTPSVASVVRFGETVPPIPGDVIEELQRDLENLKTTALIEAPEEGEEVEVADGAFQGLTGSVARVLPAKRRVQILLDFMGRSVEAELSLEQLLFKKAGVASLVLPEADSGPGPGPQSQGAARSLEARLPDCPGRAGRQPASLGAA